MAKTAHQTPATADIPAAEKAAATPAEPAAGQPATPATAAPKTDPSADSIRFEQSLAELEALVDRLEQGDLPLEESLATFERGIHLTRGCQQALDAAEQRVRLLTESAANSDSVAEPAPFESPLA